MECRPGINHIEFWVRDLNTSILFYDELFAKIGWKKLGTSAYSTGIIEIYFIEKPKMEKRDTIGPRHLCFQATSREIVNEVGTWLIETNSTIIRGPVEVNQYSEEYYTVDFRDPDGYVIEVAYTPNMEM